MGLKINKMGLVYNDANTSSFGKSFEFNIHTSDYGGKVHIVKCRFCGAPNKIPLSYIKQKFENDKKAKGEEYVAQRGSILSFRCGRCLMHTSTSIFKNTMDIYETEEYSNEVGKLADKIKGAKAIPASTADKIKASKEYQEHFNKG